MDWYSRSLADHGERMVDLGASIFKRTRVQLSIKLAGMRRDCSSRHLNNTRPTRSCFPPALQDSMCLIYFVSLSFAVRAYVTLHRYFNLPEFTSMLA